jgi:plasmid stabilization system protein ParE
LKRLEFAPEAEADLLDIPANIAADNPKRALSFADELEAKIPPGSNASRSRSLS